MFYMHLFVDINIIQIIRNIYFEEVSMIVAGTGSENHSEGKVVYRNTGGMF